MWFKTDKYKGFVGKLVPEGKPLDKQVRKGMLQCFTDDFNLGIRGAYEESHRSHLPVKPQHLIVLLLLSQEAIRLMKEEK